MEGFCNGYTRLQAISEYETYHKSAKQKRRRAGRNAARRIMEKAGKVKKHDGKDVDHKSRNNSSSKMDNSRSNLRVQSKSRNRARNGGAGGRPKAKKKK